MSDFPVLPRDGHSRVLWRGLAGAGTALHLARPAAAMNRPLLVVTRDAAAVARLGRVQVLLLIYGHYDVQPPEPLDAWDSPPFQPVIRNGRMYGRGTADNKGQFFGHFKAIESILKIYGKLPVNVKFLLDPEEEVGSPSLNEFCRQNKPLFAADMALNSDGPMDTSGRPRLIFGNRGVLYVEVNAQGANTDLHSGNFGGPIPNPAWRLVEFLSTLRKPDGTVAIEGFYDNIVPPTPKEKEMMAKIPFDDSALFPPPHDENI